MNTDERSQWIDNDEGLYLWCRQWCRSNRGGRRGFIRANRTEIDSAIERVTSGERRQHFLVYG